MKSFEALFTLLVVISFSLLILNQPEPKLNDSLYKFQLANDVWRVWQLRGDLEDFDKEKLNSDVASITELTQFCIYLEEQDIASCLGDQKIISIHKKALIGGEVKDLTLVLAR